MQWCHYLRLPDVGERFLEDVPGGVGVGQEGGPHVHQVVEGIAEAGVQRGALYPLVTLAAESLFAKVLRRHRRL